MFALLAKNLAQQEVVEVSPVRLLGVEAERIIAFLGQSGIVAPQVPVTAFNSLLLLGLASARYYNACSATDTLLSSKSSIAKDICGVAA